jgi:hypothetical protein
MKPYLHALLWLAFGAGGALAGKSDPLNQALTEQQASDRQTIASQERIEQWDDESRRMLEEYRQVLHELEILKPRNDRREQLVAAQGDELSRIQQQLESLDATQREIDPLMARMLEVLERFVALDAPFLPEERQGRLTELGRMVQAVETGQPEKYRRLLEAYQVETDYGRTIEAYRGELAQDGKRRLVEFLRLGRVALYYLTLDGEESGIWNRQQGGWTILEPRHNQQVAQAIRIANKQLPPDLMPLPLFGPGGE